MKHTFFAIFFVVFLSSCNVLRQKHRTNSILNKEIENKTKKETNSIKYEYTFLPKDSIVYNSEIFKKDSVIKKIGKNVILQASYKNNKISKVKCFNKGTFKFATIYKKTTETGQKKTTENKTKTEFSRKTEMKQDKTVYILILLGLIVILLIVVLIKK